MRSLRFVGEFTLPHKMLFAGTTVGGLSGIDYVPADDVYHLICDDKSDINPARFYTAKIRLSEKGIDTVEMLKVTTLLDASGQAYPNKIDDPQRVPDPEALRCNPLNRSLVWCSEGERIVRDNRLVLSDPSITVMDSNGKYRDTFALAENMRMSRQEKGPRQNGVFEGLSYTNNYRTLFVSTEEPLYNDGPKAGVNDTAGWIRILRYDVATRKQVAQYAYRVDPVVQEPISPGAFVVNGVSDILALNNRTLLVTERSYSTGRLTCNIRVYQANLAGATDIANVYSLQKTPPPKPIRKKLLLNMDTLQRWTDNVEGATFGPLLPNGKRSLIFVADDNFSKLGRNQFLLFEVE